MSHGTVSARLVAAALARAELLRVETTDLLKARGLSREAIDDPDARIDYKDGVSLVDEIANRSGEPDFAVQVWAMLPPGTLDLLEYIVRTSPTLGDGMRRLTRYAKILSTLACITVELDDEEMRIVQHPPNHLQRRGSEFVIQVLWTIARRAAGFDLRPLRVTFQHAAPPYRDALDDVFRCRLEFASSENSIVLPRAFERLPLPGRDERALRIFEEHAECQLERLSDAPTVAERVRQGLEQLLPARAMTLDNVARVLGMSERNLQRRLQDEGTSFREIADTARREAALRYLQTSALSISEIAARLGFSEVSAFHRSFRRWTNTTPNVYRSTPSAGRAN